MSVEPRYNLATKVMSNGVEVIVAGDRKTRPGEPEFLRLLSSTVTRPITLAPHTLSHHMSMLLPAGLQSENEVISSLQPVNQFATKTFFTTFIFPTTVVHGSKTKTTTETTVATNIKEVDIEHTQPISSQVVTLTASPVFDTQVQKTVYTYLNTVVDGEQPLVATSKYTVSNTLLTLSTVPELHPSEVFPQTNTYYATREFTRTLTDGTDSHVVSTIDTVTQVIVTDPPQTETVSADPGTIDVTKTYFVTYTYFSTYLDNDETKVTSHVSVSSDITVEKFFMKAKKTLTITPTPAPLNLIISKTLTNSEDFEKVVTETLPPDGLKAEYLQDISSKLSNGEDNPIVTTAVLNDGEKVQVTAFQGDIIDEWFEQHKIKPTDDNQQNKIKSKTKTTLKQKTKTKTVSKTTTMTIIPTSTYSTSIVATSTVTPQGATLAPGDQVIVLHGESGGTTVIPLTDPTKKKQKNETEVQVSDMLSLGALGINSMNVLGPVFNAMADLLKNHNKDALKRRNDTVPVKKTPNGNPLLNFMNDLKVNTETKTPKTTTARIPVYIPVGSLAEDSDTSESEGRINILPTPEKWTQEKWPPEAPVKQLDKNRRTHDTNPMPPLLEGGIPISPGQIITTNSDVIIGRPSDSGPRPPTFAIKDNVPVDMKPPPIEEQRIPVDSVGQFSTNQGINPNGHPMDDIDMKPPPLPPPKPVRPPKTPVHHQVANQGSHSSNSGEVHRPTIHHPQGDMKHPLHHHIPQNSGESHHSVHHLPPNAVQVHHPIHSHHPGHNQPQDGDKYHPLLHPSHSGEKHHSSNQHQHHFGENHHPVKHHPHVSDEIHLPVKHHTHGSGEINHPGKHYTHGSDESNHRPHHNIHDSGDIDLNPPPPPPALIRPTNIIPIPVHLNPDQVVENYVNPAQLQPHHLPEHPPILNEVIPTPTIPREMSKIIDRSRGQPLLVNIQPSQVAQVVIPHGSSTALIISDEQQHSTKGEVIDDPSPHPEPETVGFVGAEPVLKIENSDIPIRHVNTMAEIMKAETIPNQHVHRRPSYATETIKIRPKPDYDNIGMKPPSAPVRSPAINMPKKDPSGIYVDISPPGHLPPPHNAQTSIGNLPKPQTPPQDNFANHQTGVVHDVPLNDQVQLGSGKPGEIPVKEIVVNINHEQLSSASQVKDEINFIHRPNNDPEDLSPPPPPLPRPVRPHQGQNFPVSHVRPPKYPAMQMPVDFMTPPPKPGYNKPNVLPIGAGAVQYPSSKPTEILIMRPSDYNGDDDVDDLDEPLQTEDGEEIQESNSRPLLPGQLPPELLHNKTSNTEPGSIGVSQILTFGSGADKTEQNSIPGVREPETIVGSQMPGSPVSSFNHNNEAIVSVGLKPHNPNTNHDIDMDEAEKLFGQKMPDKYKPVEGSGGLENITKAEDINDILTPPRLEDEVMGMSPPPLERPRRPPPTPLPSPPSRPMRPKPPFKFEVPSTPSLPPNPVNMDVDFPPVRSPEMNRKPFKPEDVFPPRLPENFVHHDYDLVTPKPHRRPTVTSMPIDSPSSSTTEETTEVNGHSKPVVVTNTTLAPPVSAATRPKPMIIERPSHIHNQKPTRTPPQLANENRPNRGPPARPIDHHLPKPDQPSHGHASHPDSSKRGQPPFPFDNPQNNYGDKTRVPSRGQPPQRQPPSGPPNRGQQTYEPPPSRGPPLYEQPPNRGPPYDKPPSRGPPAYEQPVRKPPTPPRGHLPSYEHPPSGFDQPPPPPRPIPTGFDRPPSRPSPGYEQPPPRGQTPSGFEQAPPRRPIPTGFDKPLTRPTFEAPPKRVEPSPHFEGQPAQGQPARATTQPPPKAEIPKDKEVKKTPPVLHRPTGGSDEQTDQQSQPTSVYGDRNEDKPHFDNKIPQREEVNQENKPSRRPTEQPIRFPSDTATRRPPDQPSNRPSERPVEPEVPLPNKPHRGRPNYKPTPTIKPPTSRPPNNQEDIRPTPTIATPPLLSSQHPNIVTSMITSGSTTIFGDLYTDPLLLQPTRMYSSHQGVQFTVNNFSGHQVSGSVPQKVMVVASSPILPTHATTLTVTSTLTTVVHAAGQHPSTRTVLLTTTIISTIVDKVTETETLVKPTTSTVTQTHTISTTKTALVVPTAIYPPIVKYPPPPPKPEIFVAYPHDKNPKPEIFVADPHEKDDGHADIIISDPRDKDTMTISVSSSMNKNDHKDHGHKDSIDNESILVVVTDKPPPKHGGGKMDGNIVLGGVLSPPDPFPHPGSQTECLPECRPTRNELCVKQDGLMKCICRPGFARMFPDQPCKPTYTYSMQLTLDRMGGDGTHYDQGLHAPGSTKYVKMSQATKEGLNRMIMQSDLRDIYHGVAVTGFQPKEKKTMVDFYVQLSENVEEGKVVGVFKKSLRSSNFSLGGTEMFAARDSHNLHIQDFNECLNSKFHDCSEHSRCFNLKGTYTCSCKEGFTDVSENPLYPGRLCSDMIGCEFCGYHGTCYTRNEQQTCECFQWYTGDRCRINLKVLLIALVTIGAILLALLLICVIMTCLKRRGSSNASRANGSTGYLRYRGPNQSMDKRAMIVDTSSESSVENLPYVNPPPPPPPQAPLGPPRKPVLRQVKRPAPRPQPVQIPPPDQRDRSLTVMIPRVKYRALPPVSPHVTMSTFSPDKHINRTAAQMDIEQKLINYLDNGPRDVQGPAQRPKDEKRIYDQKPNTSGTKKEPRVFEYEYKTSNMHITDGTSSGERKSKDDRFRRYSDQTPLHQESNSLQHRKYSAGALVSAGYAVSATGGLIHDVEESTIHSNTLKSNRSQFTTLNRSGDHKTMSEARSYDETMIQPQTRPLCTNYSGSSSSRLNHDENHTMVERDLGSTFLLPESHLFKPAGDRGSDISNFDSL